MFCYILSNSYRISKTFIYTKRFWLRPKKTLLIINNMKHECVFVFNHYIFRHVDIFFYHYGYLPKDLLQCNVRILFGNIFCKICQDVSLKVNERNTNTRNKGPSEFNLSHYNNLIFEWPNNYMIWKVVLSNLCLKQVIEDSFLVIIAIALLSSGTQFIFEICKTYGTIYFLGIELNAF